ncbi:MULTISPECIES: Na(+)/H(+) antiporter subunit B [unclassified Exiguobacterium]|uniref:Na(+)/H(+) antiporter subunit B n=1 Tax=unclassified Exiguobacterium TaxID=2644629 RepID=UPI001BE81AFE|nr:MULTISPECIES: Na(+)/H(+) antiporter subunit B [unclassified Exiguobacterium]
MNKQVKPNNLMLRNVTRVVTFILFTFSIYLFFAGHNNPGGGFIGGLMTASALLLLYLGFSMRRIKKAVPFDFTTIIAVGLLVALATSVSSMFFGHPFLSQFYEYVQLPVLGETGVATSLPFDLGIYLVVVGMALTIILAIAEDDA